jgi:Tetracyclin repressor-like, C-terminal domain/Bacterial regulatory proteins, tetR family
MARASGPIPSTKDLSARERELLSVTIEVLDEHGYDRLTVDEVAARAHASKPTIAALLGEAIRNDELRAKLEEHFVTTRRDRIRNMLERRRAAGDIRDGFDLDLVGPIPTAIIYQRLLITHEPVDDTLPEQIVDELMPPLLT